MDTTTQDIMQQASPIQPVSVNPQSTTVSSQPESVALSPNPEQEPRIMPSEIASAYIETSHPDPELAPEVVEAGVSIVTEQPKVTPEARLVGIEPANESVPVLTEPSGLVSLPMTPQKATELLKTDHNPADARVWAANMVLYELHRKHLQEELKKKGEQFAS